MAKYEKGTFSIVPNMTAIRYMSAGTVAVYVTLCKFADDRGKCFPGANTITEWSGVGRRQVFNALNALEELGVITRLSGSEGKSNQYQIELVDEIALVQKRTLGSAKTDTGSSAKTDTLTIPIELNKELYIAKDKPLQENSKEISEIIKEFESVDQKNSTYYGNKTQRAAAKFLLDTYGIDMVVRVIRSLKITNSMEYFPVITTPCQLKDKWTTLEARAQKWKLSKVAQQNKYQVAF
jgi:hypothetical protein